jgi:hypothetical protein
LAEHGIDVTLHEVAYKCADILESILKGTTADKTAPKTNGDSLFTERFLTKKPPYAKNSVLHRDGKIAEAEELIGLVKQHTLSIELLAK